MQTAQELWDSYKELLGGRKYNAWRDLWVENGRFVIAYDRVQSCMSPHTNREFEQEIHINRDRDEHNDPDPANLLRLISGGDAKIAETKFDDKGVYQTKEDNVFFVISIIAITTTDGRAFKNYLSLKVTTEIVSNERKFMEIVEFCDPIAREALLQHLL